MAAMDYSNNVNDQPTIEIGTLVLAGGAQLSAEQLGYAARFAAGYFLGHLDALNRDLTAALAAERRLGGAMTRSSVELDVDLRGGEVF